MAQQLDSPAALSYAMWVSGGVQESFGHLSTSEHEAAEGLRIAIEIGHEQWMAGAEYTLGRTALAMLSIERAIKHLTEAVKLARSVGSAFWLDNSASYLALTHLSTHDRGAAESLLASVRAESHEPRGVSERRLLWAWGRLALESGDPERAIAIGQRLREAARRGAGEEQPIPALLSLEGEALLALKRSEEAAAALTAARDAAVARGALTVLWPIEGLLARAHQVLRHTEDAERTCADARRTIDRLAQTIEDTQDRERFERAALDSLPKLRPPSENRAAKQAFGGLTAREREVAGLVAQGRSNRDIADELVLGERTIETHVGNILSKLGFTSRAQIAAWAVESGLTKA
jgi:non-specific serine/threonine protein kinase